MSRDVHGWLYSLAEAPQPPYPLALGPQGADPLPPSSMCSEDR